MSRTGEISAVRAKDPSKARTTDSVSRLRTHESIRPRTRVGQLASGELTQARDAAGTVGKRTPRAGSADEARPTNLKEHEHDGHCHDARRIADQPERRRR